MINCLQEMVQNKRHLNTGIRAIRKTSGVYKQGLDLEKVTESSNEDNSKNRRNTNST